MYFVYALVALVILSAYIYLTRNYNYWKNQNIPYAPNAVPGFGHILPILLIRMNYGSFIANLYKKMGKHSMYGCYLMQTPALVIRDPELIKNVLQTNFSSFYNNMLTLSDNLDPIAAKNPFFANDEVWNKSRLLLSNNFSAKKLRYILGSVLQVRDQFTDYIDRAIDKQSECAEFELNDLFFRLVGEITANALFGIKGENFNDTADQRNFLSVLKRFVDPTPLNGIQQAIRFFVPGLANKVGISFVPKELDIFVRFHLKEFIKSIVNNDECKKDCFQFSIHDTTEADEDMMIALATSALFDGYESSSNALTFMFYQIAQNSSIQERAREEVNTVLERYGNILTYESVKNMNYLEQILYESLRLNPPFEDISKTCTKEITLVGYDGLSCHLKPGDAILISAVGVHMDDEFWSNPTIFNPDRFSSVNTDAKSKFTFLSFGQGPRICPGKRMGIMIVKAIAAIILQKYLLEPSVKSNGELKKSANSFLTTIEGGLWIKFKQLHPK